MGSKISELVSFDANIGSKVTYEQHWSEQSLHILLFLHELALTAYSG